MKIFIGLLLLICSGCTKLLVDDKPVEKVLRCKTCITETYWYPENRITRDSFIVCGDSAIRANNGHGITIAPPDFSWMVHKWTRCK